MFQDDNVKEKSRNTCVDKYGCEYASQTELVKDKMKETSVKRYGVDNYSKTGEQREISRNRLIADIEKRLLNGEKLGPRTGNLERECIDLLQSHCIFHIERQKRMKGYFLDGYISELNIAIEFYEKWHQGEKSRNRDMYRESFLERRNGVKFFIITEKEYIDNLCMVVDKFRSFIDSAKNKKE